MGNKKSTTNSEKFKDTKQLSCFDSVTILLSQR